MTSNSQLFLIIEAVEDKWFEKVNQFLTHHFSKVFLPSHDTSHHLRTWNNAKAILTELSEMNDTIIYSVAEAVFFSTMFHDTGLLTTKAPAHGVYSKKYYMEFIRKHGPALPALQDEILRSIELHDVKSRAMNTAFTIHDPPDILTLTNIADDLDALGAVGIYRYLEIYQHRLMSLHSLGSKILENVSLRYANIIQASPLLPKLLEHTNSHYNIIVRFFDKYNEQILAEPMPDNVLTGPLGVANCIKQFCVEGTLHPSDIHCSLKHSNVGNFVLNYFEDLENSFNERK